MSDWEDQVDQIQSGAKDSWDDDDNDDEHVVVPKKGLVAVSVVATKDEWEAEESDSENEHKPKVPTSAPINPDKIKHKKKLIGKDKTDIISSQDVTLEDPIAEKLRRQQLVEEADHRLTEELFGGSEEGSGDVLNPKSAKEYEALGALMAKKLCDNDNSKSIHFLRMLKILVRDCVVDLEPDDMKQLSSFVSVIYNDKLKTEKESKKGKKKVSVKKPQLKQTNEDDALNDMGYDNGGDAYEFM